MKISIKEFNNYKEVKGVFIGGCIKRGEGSRFHAKAHAHINKQDKYLGWICVLSEKRLKCKELLLHELAHILTNQGHTDIWRKKLLEIGGTLDEVMEEDGKKVLLKNYYKKIKNI